MLLRDAKEIRHPPHKVRKIMVGRQEVWPLTGKYLDVEPEHIWLTEANNFTEIVDIKSNTNWKID